jgi:hypothetical protein
MERFCGNYRLCLVRKKTTAGTVLKKLPLKKTLFLFRVLFLLFYYIIHTKIHVYNKKIIIFRILCLTIYEKSYII